MLFRGVLWMWMKSTGGQLLYLSNVLLALSVGSPYRPRHQLSLISHPTESFADGFTIPDLWYTEVLP